MLSRQSSSNHSLRILRCVLIGELFCINLVSVHVELPPSFDVLIIPVHHCTQNNTMCKICCFLHLRFMKDASAIQDKQKTDSVLSRLNAPQVGLEPTTTRLTAECSAIELLRNMESGSDLSSRAVSSQVLSALESLTAVFGMGTGGTSPSLPPEMVAI